MGRVQGAALSHIGVSCVHYAHDSTKTIKLLAIASLWPLAALVYACAKARHTPRLGSAPALLLTEAVARSLKHAVRQPRPAASSRLGLSASFGWPSSHAALAAAFAAHETLEAAAASGSRGPSPLRLAELAAFWLLALLAAASRCWLGYHSAAQSGAGLAVGAGVAALWWRAAGDGAALRRAVVSRLEARAGWTGAAIAWATGERARGATGRGMGVGVGAAPASGRRRR